ncbi:MAG: polynucleotide adenylyltransferase PcnB [Chromatiales bacterium]|nr:MAG: polynucleotide adenylyltransferase PcnB [Chromatiales bacterium]
MRKSDDVSPPQIIPRPEHNISRAHISKPALKVLYRLKDAGYQAFLVGGSVRDLLLGHQPKDFDVATDARPEEVRALFGNSRLIGRRFRLAHVRFGREIIEVATFRGTGNGDPSDGEHVIHESGRILKDNAWGSIEEDAIRRDFTVNALYYNIADFSIWDFAGGVDDIAHGWLRLIGDPETRYREDPVRMLRAARLAAKLGLELHPEAAEPVPRLADLLDGVPPARLFDEFLKLFQSGHALESYRKLAQLGLFEHLFPMTARVLADDSQQDFRELIEAALANTDWRIAEELPVTPMFLFAVLLWRPVKDRAATLMQDEGLSPGRALAQAAADINAQQVARVALPKRFSLPMREVLQLQGRFEDQRPRRVRSLLQHKRFRAAYDLLLLRAQVGEVPGELAEFWTAAQQGDSESEPAPAQRARRRRRRRPRRRQGNSTPAP